jgi:TonB family protein
MHPRLAPTLVRACALLLTWSALAGQQPTAARQPPPGDLDAPGGAPYRVGGEVSRPERIAGESPVYTEVARRARIQGVVILEAVIDEHGVVTATKVLKGLPMGLDHAAVDAVKTWRFRPALRGGEPVPVYYVLTVSFALGNGEGYAPRFAALLEAHHDLAELVRAARWPEAVVLLDGWARQRPDEVELPLARAYVFAGAGRLDDAWREAQAYTGPEPHEVLQHVASRALDRLTTDASLDEPARADILEIGLRAVSRALEASPDRVELLRLRSALLDEQRSGGARP